MAGSRITVEDHVNRVTDALVRDFGGEVPEAVIRRYVDEAFADYRDARIPHYVPVLVDRAVRHRLRAPVPAWPAGLPTTAPVIDITEVSV